jgi:hypothetical protein
MKHFTLIVITAGIALFSTSLLAQEPPAAQPPAAQPPAAQAPAAQAPAAEPVQAGAPAQNQTISGTLVDAACKASTPTDKCEVAETTKTFGIQTSDGKYVKLDNAGNAKVRVAIQSGQTKTGAIKASLSGAMDGEMLKVETVQLD